LTEFLPVSSTAHLILAEKFLGFPSERFGLSFDASLHLGTLLSLLVFFGQDIIKIIKNFITALVGGDLSTPERRLPFIILSATILGAIIGVIFETDVETTFRSPFLIAFTLILFSLVLFYVDHAGSKTKQLKQMTYSDGVLIGLAQAIALIPGVSRSGITLATGIWRNLTREAAIRFTFLLSIPIILGAGGKQLLTSFLNGSLITEWQFFLTGMIFSFIFGVLAIRFMLRFLHNHSLVVFIVYRLFLGGLILAWFSFMT
jgi:undecaprenyl-diphosphatase